MISKKNVNKIIRKVGRAIGDYGLIQNQDHILVALSGGKDSLALLEVLLHFQHRAPLHFTLTACTIDEKYGGFNTELIADFCQVRNVPLTIKHEDFPSIIKVKKIPGTSPCSLCARLRRGILYTYAKQIGCTKIALAHHADDFIETLLLDLFFSGSSWKMPVNLVSKDRKNIVIRPLVYVFEQEIASFCQDQQITPIAHPCYYSDNHRSRRAQVKEWLTNLSHTNPNLKGNLLRAVLRDQKDAKSQ